MPAATSAAVAAAPTEHTGIAGGVINAARQTGSVVGVAALGAMVTGGQFLPGFQTAVAAAAAVFAVAAILVASTLATSAARGDEAACQSP